MPDITRKRTRERLAARREPYWQRLAAGSYLGFRRGADSWIARFRDREGKQQYNALGDGMEYDEAKRRAEQWLAQLAGSPVRITMRGTVWEALQAYIEDLRRHGRPEAATESQGRFNSIVRYDPIALQVLESMTLEDMQAWRDRLRPGRQPRSINRHVRSVVAGLNKAHALGHIGNPRTWRLTALADDVEDEGDTAVFLDPQQRRGLMAKVSPNAGLFLKALELTGARPREMAATTCGDFDGETIRLAHRKGRPAKLRVRFAVLSDDGAAFFKAQTKGRPADAPIFAEDGTQPWRRHVWAREVRAAITAHNEAKPKSPIPVDASAYSFRHARISELLQVYHIDPLTVAAQTGTSLAIIEKSYFKFIPSAMREKLAAVRD